MQGIPTVSRAVINKKGSGADARYNLLVEGYNLLSVMATPGVVGSRTTSNHIIEVMTVRHTPHRTHRTHRTHTHTHTHTQHTAVY
jgi:hypothetical protein